MTYNSHFRTRQDTHEKGFNTVTASKQNNTLSKNIQINRQSIKHYANKNTYKRVCAFLTFSPSRYIQDLSFTL
jgi:hypothetical protein